MRRRRTRLHTSNWHQHPLPRCSSASATYMDTKQKRPTAFGYPFCWGIKGAARGILGAACDRSIPEELRSLCSVWISLRPRIARSSPAAASSDAGRQCDPLPSFSSGLGGRSRRPPVHPLGDLDRSRFLPNCFNHDPEGLILDWGWSIGPVFDQSFDQFKTPPAAAKKEIQSGRRHHRSRPDRTRIETNLSNKYPFNRFD